MQPFEQEIERFVRTGQGPFEALALSLFAFQYERNKPYQAFCQAQGKTPASVKRWQDIPAVPMQAFKAPTPLTTVIPERAAAVFHSSSTTGKTPSKHYLGRMVFYETALQSSFKEWVLADQATVPFFVLTPPPGDAPHSSLSWMMDVLVRKLGAPGSDYFIQRGLLDDWKLGRALAAVQSRKMPVALLGTTLSFLAFFERCAKAGKTYPLPAGSRVMDTGGMKSDKREVTRDQFLSQVSQYLGIAEDQCFNEYGMCEMSSQFYSKGSSQRMQGPAWVRTLVVNPMTGKPVQDGQTGLLWHFDLANVDSVMAIQTEDLGQADGNRFILKGRAKEADLKGCSLAAEAFFQSR